MTEWSFKHCSPSNYTFPRKRTVYGKKNWNNVKMSSSLLQADTYKGRQYCRPLSSSKCVTCSIKGLRTEVLNRSRPRLIRSGSISLESIEIKSGSALHCSPFGSGYADICLLDGSLCWGMKLGPSDLTI